MKCEQKIPKPYTKSQNNITSSNNVENTIGILLGARRLEACCRKPLTAEPGLGFFQETP